MDRVPRGEVPLRDKTRDILADLLSGVIERVRAKTGDDMLSVAEQFSVNSHNRLLHAIPLKEGVRDVCSALRTRKRKRVSVPSESECSASSDTDCTGISDSFMLENGNSERLKASDFSGEPEQKSNGRSGSKEKLETVPKQQLGKKSHFRHTKGNLVPVATKVVLKKSRPKRTVSKKPKQPSSPNKSNSKQASPKKKSHSSSKQPNPPKKPNSKAAKQTVPAKPSLPSKPSIPAPSTDPAKFIIPPSAQSDSKQKKRKRTKAKDLHKNCARNYIKLENVVMPYAPLLPDDDDPDELMTLIEPDCPAGWVAGNRPASIFRRRGFCRRCTIGDTS